MAYRRCLSVRATLLARRSSHSFRNISLENDRDKPEESHSSGSAVGKYFAQRRWFGSCLNGSSWPLQRGFCRQGSGLALSGLCLNRYLSSSMWEASDETVQAGDTATVISDAPMEAVTSQLPAMSEVAVAAADSSFPFAALQHLIDGVHSLTGLNWLASIALTTLLIQGVVSLSVDRHGERFAYFKLIVKEVEEIAREQAGKAEASGDYRRCLDETRKRAKETARKIRKGWGIIFLPQLVFLSFFPPILNMAEKVPSFKIGGALWFTDLTTPDAMCIFPVLIALTSYATRELRWERECVTKFMNTAVDILALSVALAMNCPTAVYVHWLAWEILTLCLCIRQYPSVRKAPGI